MIERVVIRRFKRFQDVTFDLPGHIVLAGPNNCGKTTMLQAIAVWDLAFTRWREVNRDIRKPRGVYSRVPIARQAFSAVPLRIFDLLWNNRTYSEPIEIEISHRNGWTVAMELQRESTEQIYVRPTAAVDSGVLYKTSLKTVFVPPMSGLGTAEPVYQPPKIEQLLGQSKPGDVIRNLMAQAHASTSWDALKDCINRLFRYELMPPDSTGADILAEYRTQDDGPKFDIASAGSGFQQVLMLLTFLHTRPGAVLLLDEPDAHLHVILQDAIYGELRSVAAKTNSQLIISTHSEVIINAVEPRELCALFNHPKLLATTEEQQILIRSLGILSNEDLVLALQSPGVLYVEDYTDLQILREWARVLGHPAYDTLTRNLFWKRIVHQSRSGAEGIQARKHFDALKLVRTDYRGLEIVDGDAHADMGATAITGQGLQRVRWKRYEIESYLLHPEALARYVRNKVGGDATLHTADLMKHFQETYPPTFLKDPFLNSPYLLGTKARTLILPPALDAAGLPGISYTSYHEIAAIMLPQEVHPEVKEKLDAIQRAFGL